MVFHAKGWWPKTSCPPSKLCLPWVSKRGIRDVPGILPGCPRPLAVFKKLVQKNFVRIFRSLIKRFLIGQFSHVLFSHVLFLAHKRRHRGWLSADKCAIRFEGHPRNTTLARLKSHTCVGCTPKGAYSSRGRSGHLLETPFSERTPSENPSENPSLL